MAYPSLDDFVEGLLGDETELSAIEYHLVKLRRALAQRLWSRKIFIGTSVLDSMLYSAVTDPSVNDPAARVVALISQWNMHRPGVVVYPLHSLGMLDLGLFRLFSGARIHLCIPQADVALTAQTNSTDASKAFLNSVLTDFSINKRLPLDHLDHYLRSRPLRWFTRNPLLVLRVHSFSGEYYENQFLLTIRLQFATSLLFMMHALQPRNEAGRWRGASTSIMNNWQTLDISHYLLFESQPGNRRTLGIRCVPMNISRSHLAELSEVSIELEPRTWAKRRKSLPRLIRAISAFEELYLKNRALGNVGGNGQARLAQKLFDSLAYFRRSFRTDRGGSAIISLAIAFEIMLTDSYAQGVGERLVKRLKELLRGVPGTRNFQRHIRNLYFERNSLVHSGVPTGATDLAVCQRAFVLAFLRLQGRMHVVARNDSTPIKSLLGA